MRNSIDFDRVADIYDAYVNVEFDIPFYQTLCRQYQGRILELMCGTGRVSIPLINAGIDLTCVDYSPEMLRVLKRKVVNKKVPVIQQNVVELDLEQKYSLIFIPFHSFSEIINPQDRCKALERMSDHLDEGGDLLITLYNPDDRLKSVDGKMKTLGQYHLPPHQSLVVSYYNVYRKADNVVTGAQYYDIYDKQNRLVEKRSLDIAFSLITQTEITQMAARVGLNVKNVFGDYHFEVFSETSRFMHCLFSK